MNIKIISIIEKIGALLIVIGVIFMILNDLESNPIPQMTDKNKYINIIGLILWVLGYQSRIAKEKKEKSL